VEGILGYYISQNRFKEKSTRSNFLLRHDKWHDIDNNWLNLERLRPYKRGQERWSTGLGYTIALSTNSIIERKRLNYEGNDYLQKTYHILWLPLKTKQIHGPNCFTNIDRNKTFKFPLSQNLRANYGIYVASCVICPVALLTGGQGCEPPFGKLDVKTGPPLTLYFGVQHFYGFE